MTALPTLRSKLERRIRRPGSQRRACIVRQGDAGDPTIQRAAEALVDAGFEVDVIALRFGDQPRRSVVHGFTITRLARSLPRSTPFHYALEYAWFFLLAAGTVTARHLRRPYTVVQVATMPDFLVFAAAVPKLLGSRLIVYMNEPVPELFETRFGRNRLTRVLERAEQGALRFADQAVTVTDQLKERYVERGADAEKITVVLVGADPALRLDGWSPPPEKRTDEFVVICHGSIEERYGHDTIVEAADLLRSELPALRFVFTGRGPRVEHVLKMIEERDLQDVIRFEGWVEQQRLNDLLATADVGIVAQKASSYSHLVHTNKMVDYWIFGLPVIATRLRAVSARYDDSVIEYFEPGDPHDLARAIRRLHDDPERRRELARNGRAAQQQNGWATQRQIFLGIYESLLARGA